MEEEVYGTITVVPKSAGLPRLGIEIIMACFQIMEMLHLQWLSEKL